MLYFNLSFIYIHIEFSACHMLPDIVLGYRPGSSFSLLKAAEHICLCLLEVMQKSKGKNSTSRRCAIVQQKIHVNDVHRLS